MSKFNISPDRIREVWISKDGSQHKVVYWDIDDDNGIGWPLESDLVGEFEHISKFTLLNYGWIRHEQASCN